MIVFVSMQDERPWVGSFINDVRRLFFETAMAVAYAQIFSNRNHLFDEAIRRVKSVHSSISNNI